ncbi:hypothetical protein BDZ97DRAFT_2071909 [Flammula alnicola]|nr:hypothetical protein BDZ97DRAFT_2071909 [Flammula alnicola]
MSYTSRSGLGVDLSQCLRKGIEREGVEAAIAKILKPVQLHAKSQDRRERSYMEIFTSMEKLREVIDPFVRLLEPGKASEVKHLFVGFDVNTMAAEMKANPGSADALHQMYKKVGVLMMKLDMIISGLCEHRYPRYEARRNQEIIVFCKCPQ